MKEAAGIFRDNVQEIMTIWEKEVVSQVPAAREANQIALRDHLPRIIIDIADILDRHAELDDITKDEKYKEILENSKHHGRHRATSTNYTVDQVVHEYIIFHRTLSEFLAKRKDYSQDVLNLLKYVIETSILKSVATFSDSIQAMQEKLIGTIAHDIRNPLSASLMSLELLEDSEDINDENKKMLDTARRNLVKSINLMEGLMDGITIGAGQGMMFRFKEVNILDEIKFVVQEAVDIFNRKIELTSNDEPITGIFDGTSIKRLLENLISNAVKYGLQSKPISVHVAEDDEEVEIRVHNYGNPIPKEKQKNVFSFLVSARNDDSRNSKSWGMGLTLVQMVADAHGGDIKLTSSEEEGTTFIVRILRNFNEPGERRTNVMGTEK